MNKNQIDAIRAERNKYLRAWRAKNKDKVKRYNEAYWLKKHQASEAVPAQKEESDE